MMKQIFSCRTTSILALLLLARLPLCAQPALLEHAGIEYPNPYFPYYHFKADLHIPYPGYLETEISVNGEKLRYFSLKDHPSDDNIQRTMIHYRPAFADTYTVNNQLFEKPFIAGRLAWQPGTTYNISVTVRLKKQFKRSPSDLILKGNVHITAPADSKVFDPAWRHYKSVVVSETEGISRSKEPIELTLAFYADEARTLSTDLRVLAYGEQDHSLTEIPSQVYDITQDVTDTDPLDSAATLYARSNFKVPIWVPTTTARVVFQADVPAHGTKIYLLYHDNPRARPPAYPAAISMKGPAPGLTFDKSSGKVRGIPIEIGNDLIKVSLHPHSGVINEVTLRSKPNAPFYQGMETNGALHWAPEAYAPPRPWTHTSDWMQPKFEVWKGPVEVTTLASGSLPLVPEVDAAVSYRFYASLPYIETTTSTRVNEPLAVQAMRNGEVIFKRDLITHIAWFDPVEKKVQTVELSKIADLDEVLMDERTPWISFFNPSTGIAFGGIKMESVTAGLEHLPRIVNPYYYCIVGPTVYWSHAMNFTFASSASQLMIKVPKGAFLWEKWAYLPYELQPGPDPHSPLIEWQKKLTSPLCVRLSEEVEQRVPTVGTEIYIDPSKTGWEGRETMKK